VEYQDFIRSSFLGGITLVRSDGETLMQDAAFGIADLNPHRHSAGDPKEPRGQRISATDRARLAGEHHESRLESILRLMPVLEDDQAGPVNHRAVPPNQGSKRRRGDFSVSGQVMLDQLTVRHTPDRPHVEEDLDLANWEFAGTTRHGFGSLGLNRSMP
jgi:hypothetical protein